MAIGELFLSAIIQALVQELTSHAIRALARRERVENPFNKLNQSLSFVLAVLEDAEEKQLTDSSVKVWLEALWDIAYDLDDILDEIKTRSLILDLERNHSQKAPMVLKVVPNFSCFTPDAIVFNSKMRSKMKDITCRLQDIAKQRSDLNLKEYGGGSSNRSFIIKLPSTSLVNDSEVYGRDEDKESIIELLCGSKMCGDDISVIPIVGMGGIGKTTLAQIVYNDKVVQQSFHVKVWVCVSEEFDVISITRTIYELVTKMEGNSKDFDTLQVSLKAKLAKSKFLIVLDDVWNEDYQKWDALCRPFKFGLKGSRIIVTTRNESVASVVGSPRAAHHMKLLTDEDCLSLLAQHARTSFLQNPELKDVGMWLVKKCKGLPLAAKAVGGLLRSKETKEEWENVLNSKIWDLPVEKDILPVLRLSYYHLPSHLKHLFAYCSIFPKDYKFDRNELVYLWMGEGFLEQRHPGKSKEELGIECFNELLSRSFFQRLSGRDSGFVMHDLINDLAGFVAGRTCYRLDEKMDATLEYQLPEKTRHGSFLRHEYEVFQKFKAFSQVKGLRTFLPMPVQNSQVWPPFYMSNRILVELVPELRNLRVLSLSGYSITELPSLICELIQLRYLNLSGTSIFTLPDSLGGLVNLQTLSVSNCRFIRRLPSSLGNLTNLRHCDNSETDQLKDLPIEIGRLWNLQTLPKVVLQKGGRFLGLKQLQEMKHLNGTVAIFELQNVTDIQDVEEVRLGHKHKIDDLQLHWGAQNEDSPVDDASILQEEVVIELLQPHEQLRKLKVEFYRGIKFPVWIGDRSYRNLSDISIISCTECTSLPPLGQLPGLKNLHIGNMSRIQRIGREFYSSLGGESPFQKLEVLRFDNMPELIEWHGEEDNSSIHFPQLQELTLIKCGKLVACSPLCFPALRKLDIEESNKILLECFSTLSCLNHLKVEAVSGLSHLPSPFIESLFALENLECCSCNEMVSVWPDETEPENITRLKRLVLVDCSQLSCVGHGERQLPPNLESFELFDCSNLSSLPNDLSTLPSLKEMIIKNCFKLVTFPESGIPESLKRIEIQSCNALVSLPDNLFELERLEIKDCKSLQKWEMRGSFPIGLKKLTIKNCSNLEAIPEAMFSESHGRRILLEEVSLSNWINFKNLLHCFIGLRHLSELHLSGCDSIKSFPEEGLPANLRSLSVENCTSLKSLPSTITAMKHLVSMEIRSCPSLNSFPNFDFPSQLSCLRIWDSKKLKPLRQWGLDRLLSLTEFSICGGFKEADHLGMDDGGDGLFPPSLIRFSVARFPRLVSLGRVVENLKLLRYLSITNCGNVKVLPSEGVMERLWHLEISDCQRLREKCVRNRGEYWGKIAGIPCVEIDGTYVYRIGRRVDFN